MAARDEVVTGKEGGRRTQIISSEVVFEFSFRLCAQCDDQSQILILLGVFIKFTADFERPFCAH